MSTTRRRYSDQDKADALVVLDACDGNVSEASRRTGIPAQTLSEWRDGRVSDDVPKLREEKKAALSDRLEAIAHELLDSVKDKIGDATLKDTMVSVGVAIDKALVLRGDPNSITKAIGEGTDARRDLAELLFRGRTAGSNQPAPGRGPAASASADRGGVPAVN